MGSITGPSSGLLQRSWTKEYPTAVGGDGIYIRRSDGSRVLDGCCGAAVSCLGHSDREVIDAIVAQAQKMPFVHGSFFTNQPAEDLARHLIEVSDDVFSKALFLSSGWFPQVPPAVRSDLDADAMQDLKLSRRR